MEANVDCHENSGSAGRADVDCHKDIGSAVDCIIAAAQAVDACGIGSAVDCHWVDNCRTGATAGGAGADAESKCAVACGHEDCRSESSVGECSGASVGHSSRRIFVVSLTSWSRLARRSRNIPGSVENVSFLPDGLEMVAILSNDQMGTQLEFCEVLAATMLT